MDVWCGHVILDKLETNNRLEDIQISHPREDFRINRWTDVHLQFLSFVDTAAVPLHLVSGPSFDVSTCNEITESWLNDRFRSSPRLSKDADQQLSRWWENKSGQSDMALLLQVDGDIKIANCHSRVMELLIYAGPLRYAGHAPVGMLTPPRSSSPVAEYADLAEDFDGSTRTVQLYALPLSSDLSHGVPGSPNRPSPPPEETSQEYACFIPSLTEDLHQAKGRKRLHLDSLFKDASHQVKRSKRRGGEGIAKAMASLDSLHSQTIEQSNSQLESGGNDGHLLSTLAFGKPGIQKNNGLSRAHSLGSLRDLDSIRPPSRGNAALGRRSTLSRVTSVGMFESSSPIPEFINSIEQQNKAALSRVVMAGMRIYGLQQRKRSNRSRAASEMPLSAGIASITSIGAEEEDEYKLVYHQTYKAAAFAFRKILPVANIGQDRMRDIVDRILEMFCIDLLAEPESIGTVQQSFKAETTQDHSPFDPPSNCE